MDNGGCNDKVNGTKVGIHGSLFFAGVVVLHKLVHYGRYWNFKPSNYETKYEAGSTFENWAFKAIQNYESSTASAIKNGW